MKLSEKNNKSESNQNILEKYFDFIFDKEIWINKEVYKIAEVTYTYESEFSEGNYQDGYHFNFTLFSNIAGLDYEVFKNANDENKISLLKLAGEEVEKIVNLKINDIEKTIIEVNKIEYKTYNLSNLSDLQREINNKEIFNLQKEIFLGSLEYNKKLLNQAILGLPFELEKAGLNNNITKVEIDDRIKKIDAIDKELFGGNIKDNKEEVIKTYERFRTKVEEEGKNEEFIKELEALEKLIKKLYTKGYEFKKYQEAKKVTLKNIDTDNSNKTLVEIFNTYNQSQNIDYPVVLDNVGNITDDIDSLKIPIKVPSYKLITTIKRFAHEIDAHTINLKNGIKLIGILRGSKNLDKEEGLAMLLEYLFEHGKNAYKTKKEIDIDKIDVGQYFPKYLLAEILDSKKIVEFITKYNDIEKDSASTPVARLLRMKRNRPFNYLGHQCKDMTYTRGMIKTAKYINFGKDPKNLFLGKVGFDDLDKLAKIKELKEKNGEILELNEPIFMYEQIYFKLLQKFDKDNYKKIDFYNYLKDKYPIIEFSEFQFKSLIKSTKYRVYKILNLFEKEIIENNKTA